ncbi:MAG: hypothetical protein K5919_09280 [Clostridiales bacterium]|nr:hypothetical protein [Clostridiales bacterium]
MTEQRERALVRRAFDGGLSGLKGDPFLARRVLAEAEKAAPARRKKRLSAVLIAALALLLTAVTAYAVSRAVLSPRVDAKKLANQALEEKYGLTSAMLGFFGQDAQGTDGRHWRVTYTRDDALGTRMGSYRVQVTDGQVESVSWTLDGKNTAGGFDAEAWGAEQLKEMVKITGKTHDMSRFYNYLSGKNVDLYAGMDEKEPDAMPEEGWPEVDEDIQAEAEAFRREVEEAGKPYEAQSRFTKEELIDLGRRGIIQAYDLNAEQQERLQYVNTLFFISYYSSIGPENRPTFNMTFQSGGGDGWQEGDGIYTVMVNVLDGTVEYLDYDTTLDGNG